MAIVHPIRRGTIPDGESGLTVAGVDLGHERTRVVVLRTASNSPPAVIGSADEPTPAGLFFSGRIQRPVEAGAWVRRVLAAVRGGGVDQLVLAVGGTDVQVRRVAVPPDESRDAVLRALRSQGQLRGGADSPAEWHLEYHELDREAGHVLGVAASAYGIAIAQAVARAAGYARPVITAVEVALANAWLAAADTSGRWLVVEGGHSAVTIALLQGGVPVAFRRVLLGGRELQRAQGGAGDILPAAAEEWAGRVAHEMRLLVGAVVRDGSVLPPVALCGGLAASAAVRDALRRARGAEVSVLGLGRGGESAAHQPSAALAVAYGLAVSGADVTATPELASRLVRVDLYQADRGGAGAHVGSGAEVLRALARDARTRLVAIACVITMLGIGVLDAKLARGVDDARAALAQARGDSVKIETDLRRLRELESERARLGVGADAILALDRARDAWPMLMARVASTIPQYVWLSGRQEMKEADPQTGAFGFVLRGYAGSGAQVAEFERRLRGGVVTDVAVASTGRVDLAGLDVIGWEIRGRAGHGALVPVAAHLGYGSAGGDMPASDTSMRTP